MLVDVEIEHHVHPIALAAEEFLVLLRQNIGFAKDDGIALTPLQELAQFSEKLVVAAKLAVVSRFDQKGNGVETKSGNPKLQPETHDALNLGLHCGIVYIE